MVGLFSRTPKDPQTKQNVTKIKELKKLVKEKKYSEAIKSRTEYLRKVPYNHDVLFTVDRIYYLKNKYRLTISYFDKSLEINSYDPDVLLLKVYAHQKLGENKRVIQCCNKIHEIDPKNKTIYELLK